MYQTVKAMKPKVKTTLIIALVAMLCVCFPVSANTHVASGGTIVAGDEHYDLDFVTDECTMFGLWRDIGIYTTPPLRTVNLALKNDAVFSLDAYQGGSGLWRCLDETTGAAKPEGTTFHLIVHDIVTPTPTPSEGTISISSSPSEATVYVDNFIRGITPITVKVENGQHTIRLKMDGYADSRTDVSVIGDIVTVSENLIPITTPPTTVPPTTNQTQTPTLTPTTEIPTTEPTQEITQEMDTTQQEEIATIDYSETIAAMQTQINAQSTQLSEQAAQLETQAAINQQQEEDIGLLQQIINTIKALLDLE